MIRVLKFQLKNCKWFFAIMCGKKEVEGRWNKYEKDGKKKYDGWKEGDYVDVRLIDNDVIIDSRIFEIKYVHHYGSFKKMIEEERRLYDNGIEAILPEKKSITECVDVYHNIDGFEDGAKTNGVVAIGLMCI